MTGRIEMQELAASSNPYVPLARSNEREDNGTVVCRSKVIFGYWMLGGDATTRRLTSTKPET